MSTNERERRGRGRKGQHRPGNGACVWPAPHVMNYADYSTEDFLADESFQDFVLARDPAAVAFWQDWASQRPGQTAAFDEAVAVLQLFGQARPAPLPQGLRQAEVARFWQGLRAPQPVLRSGRAGRVRRRATAAGLLLLALLGLGLGWWLRPVAPAPLLRYATLAGQQRTVRLPDGSQVRLNASSVLTLAPAWQPGAGREVWLTGEAFFDVRHTAPAALRAVAAAPVAAKFVVHAGGLDVAVLGTRFDVRHVGAKTSVVLSSGQIALSRAHAAGQPPLLMQPGDLVRYDEAAPQRLAVERTVQPALYAAWTSGRLDFDNTPVADIVALLEDRYGLRVRLGRPGLARQKLTGTLPGQNPDVLLEALGKSLDIKVRRQGSEVWFD